MSHTSTHFHTDHSQQERSFCDHAFLDKIAPHAHWGLRIALASVFLYHGAGKFMMLDNFSAMMGLPVYISALVALAEVGGSILILVGGFLDKTWMTRIGAMMFVPVMLGAISMVHWGQWSFVASETHKMGGMEFQVVLLLISLFLVIKGNKA